MRSAASEPVVLEVPNDVARIEGAVEDLMRCCEPVCSDRKRLLFNFRIGLSEALANAILYGNADDPDKRVRVELRIETEGIRVRVTDHGRGFDPAAVPDPTLPENIAKPVGRGIFLMRALMDEVIFNASGNSVTLVLRLPGDGPEPPSCP